MNLGSRWVNGRKMRRGYTTGSCAAAAAKAAVSLLFSIGSQDAAAEAVATKAAGTSAVAKDGAAAGVAAVEIATPAGIILSLPVCAVERNEQVVSCAVKKDAGDDPDITDGLLIWASARRIPEGIKITGGPGVGIVRLPGLSVQPGEPAINPVPRRMITEEVQKVLPAGEGVEITISIPGGEEIAQKTFNPRLGIEGGLSVIGTSGLVEPMSEEAWQESLRLELKQLAARGINRVILVPGNYGYDFACAALGLKGQPLVKFSNYAGFILKTAAALEFREILLVSDLGKLVKVAAGIFHTHSSVADARMEIMAAYAGALGAGQELIRRVLEMNTTGAALEVIEEAGIRGLPQMVAERAAKKAAEHIHNRAALGTVVFSGKKLLAMSAKGKKIVESLRNE